MGIGGRDGPTAIPREEIHVPTRRCPISTQKTATTATRTLLFTKIIAAVAKYLTVAVVMGGKSLTPQAIAAVFQAYLQAQADLDEARTAVTAKQQARDTALAAAVAMIPPLKKYLAGTYGEESTTFTDFGFEAPKTPVKSAKVKAAAAEKATTTRKAHDAAVKAPVPAPVPTPKS